MSEQRSPDTPFLGGGDSFRPDESRREVVFADASGEVRGLARDALRAMSESGDNAEGRYQETLSALRQADEAAATIGATYNSLAEDQYLERWSMVQLLNDLRTAPAVEVLAGVLGSPIPAEQSPDPAHGLSTVAEEIMIRTTAVEALVRLASDGDERARDLLVAQTRHEARSVRRAAVQGVLGLGDEGLAAQVREALAGTDDEWMLGVRRLDVREVTQADAVQTLRPQTKEGDSTPPEPLTN